MKLEEIPASLGYGVIGLIFIGCFLMFVIPLCEWIWRKAIENYIKHTRIIYIILGLTLILAVLTSLIVGKYI
jgi:hypothetical protein